MRVGYAIFVVHTSYADSLGRNRCCLGWWWSTGRHGARVFPKMCAGITPIESLCFFDLWSCDKRADRDRRCCHSSWGMNDSTSICFSEACSIGIHIYLLADSIILHHCVGALQKRRLGREYWGRILLGTSSSLSYSRNLIRTDGRQRKKRIDQSMHLSHSVEAGEPAWASISLQRRWRISWPFCSTSLILSSWYGSKHSHTQTLPSSHTLSPITTQLRSRTNHLCLQWTKGCTLCSHQEKWCNIISCGI